MLKQGLTVACQLATFKDEFQTFQKNRRIQSDVIFVFAFKILRKKSEKKERKRNFVAVLMQVLLRTFSVIDSNQRLLTYEKKKKCN